jgi:nucleotide-binding universal stress UspA family protein
LPGKAPGSEEGEPAARTDPFILKRVLCATDFSPAAAVALELGVEIRVVHVRPSPVPAGCGMACGPMDRKGRDQLIESLDRSAQGAIACGLTTRRVLLQGDPAEAMLREARESAADLIAMGRHARGGASSAILGSVTERVIKDAACPVLVAGSLLPPRAEGHRHVLCALDLGETAGATLAHAVAAANALGGDLLVLHVAADGGHQGARSAMAGLVAKAPVANQGLQERLVTGVPGDEILAAARQTGSDLVVVGSHGGRVAKHTFLGSTTLHLLRHCECPLLVVPVGVSRSRERASAKSVPSALDMADRPDVATRLRSCEGRPERRRPSGWWGR